MESSPDCPKTAKWKPIYCVLWSSLYRHSPKQPHDILDRNAYWQNTKKPYAVGRCTWILSTSALDFFLSLALFCGKQGNPL